MLADPGAFGLAHGLLLGTGAQICRLRVSVGVSSPAWYWRSGLWAQGECGRELSCLAPRLRIVGSAGHVCTRVSLCFGASITGVGKCTTCYPTGAVVEMGRFAVGLGMHTDILHEVQVCSPWGKLYCTREPRAAVSSLTLLTWGSKNCAYLCPQGLTSPLHADGTDHSAPQGQEMCA